MIDRITDDEQEEASLWKIITIVLAIVASATVLYYGWQLRQPLFERFTGLKVHAEASRIPNPSEETKKALMKYADTHDYVLGLNVVKVDFRLNTRDSTFHYFTEKDAEEGWQQFLTQHGSVVPLFGQDESANQRMVNMMNGQFNCTKIGVTPAGKLIPGLTERATDLCLVPIPPGFGDFVGFITIYLKRSPSGIEVSQIEKDTEQLSLDFYNRDISKPHASSATGTSNPDPIK